MASIRFTSSLFHCWTRHRQYLHAHLAVLSPMMSPTYATQFAMRNLLLGRGGAGWGWGWVWGWPLGLRLGFNTQAPSMGRAFFGGGPAPFFWSWSSFRLSARRTSPTISPSPTCTCFVQVSMIRRSGTLNSHTTGGTYDHHRREFRDCCPIRSRSGLGRPPRSGPPPENISRVRRRSSRCVGPWTALYERIL